MHQKCTKAATVPSFSEVVVLTAQRAPLGVFAELIPTSIVGLVMDLGIGCLERSLLRWRPGSSQATLSA